MAAIAGGVGGGVLLLLLVVIIILVVVCIVRSNKTGMHVIGLLYIMHIGTRNAWNVHVMM